MEIREMCDQLSEIEHGLLMLASKTRQPRASYYMELRAKLTEIRESLLDRSALERHVREKASTGEGTIFFVHELDLYESKPAGYSGSGRAIVPLDNVRVAIDFMVSYLGTHAHFSIDDVVCATGLPKYKVYTIVNSMMSVGILESDYRGLYATAREMPTDVDEWIRVLWSLPDRIDELEERNQW
ncbi:MAG: hypothetical protein Q4A01_01655 [Coriobacteriales bacterium]|nr:hypothetical protein [Coriobacteriales bacterium]